MEGKVASRSLKKKRPFSVSIDEDDQSNNRHKKPRLSLADHQQQSIPSMVDGLKLGQRKVLFSAFKDNLVTDITVAAFSAHVLGSAGYNHCNHKSFVATINGMAATIIGMAQDFVGTNNINLLNSGGQCGFGSRYEGDKVHPKTWQIDTNLAPIARFLFPKDDDIILNYLNENGKRIEPTWYAPVIPMVLVNGTKGFGKGWSTFVPSYNPKDLCANVRRLLRGEPMVPIDPWYKGFQGTIEKTTIKESGASYTVSGIIEQIDETTLRITELPLRRWARDYDEFLMNKIKEKFIKDYTWKYNPLHFEIIMSKKNLRIAKEEGLMKKFKLTTTISTSNMYLFDPKGVIKKYDNPEQILEEFFHLRLQLYEKRKKMLLANLEVELLKLDNKVRFIHCVMEDMIIIWNRKIADILPDLVEKGFTAFPKTKSIDALVVGATEDVEENEENSEVATNGEENKREVRASDYEYLLSMSRVDFTIYEVQELSSQQEKLTSELDELRKSTPETLWIKDLDALEQKLLDV